MIHSPRSGRSGQSDNSSDFRRVFRRRVHQLIQLGYECLTPARYSTEQEPAITGELVKAIDEVLDGKRCSWMSSFSVHDDPPVNDGKRKGKKRLRVDIRFDCSTTSPRTRYRIEAKRLGKGNSLGAYLGAKGLGCFLSGAYGKDEDIGGMIGYVQSLNCQNWSNKISVALAQAVYLLRAGSIENLAHFTNREILAFQATHSRPTLNRDIQVDHIFMRFY